MPEPLVATVMTRAVLTVVIDTPFQELVATLTDRAISSLPVIDSCGLPLGVVSDTDVLAKLEFHCGADLPPLLAGRHTRARWRKARGLTAADLMTTPAITIPAWAPITTATLQLADTRLRRLCVVDHTGRLIGILARRDLLRLFLRSDCAIQADIEHDLTQTAAGPIHVDVTGGIATLTGTVTWRSASLRADHTARCVPGVIDLHNHLTYQVDDLAFTGL